MHVHDEVCDQKTKNQRKKERSAAGFRRLTRTVAQSPKVKVKWHACAWTNVLTEIQPPENPRYYIYILYTKVNKYIL